MEPALASLVTTIERIADLDFQRTAWLGVGPFMSSPDEMLSQYFDDQDAERVISSLAGGDLHADELTAIQTLHNQMRKFVSEMPTILDPAETLNDPRWRAIAELARRVIKLFGENGRLKP